jgi:hypothetical protein
MQFLNMWNFQISHVGVKMDNKMLVCYIVIWNTSVSDFKVHSVFLHIEQFP